MSPSPPAPFLLPLDDPAATLDRVGGKGASLASTRAAGFPVPNGFHVTTDAYRSFLSENALAPEIERAFAGHAEQSLRRLRQSIQSGAMSDELVSELRIAYAGLPGARPSVAVRSSATAEDLPDASFAGQQDTLLNVRGVNALLEAIRQAWASLWTERAVQYRDRLGIDHRTVAMGVVVQIMVPADIAGVMFTANPTTGERSEIVINASFGLGEAIVSGLVNPDTYTVRTSDLTPTAVHIGDKSEQIVASGTEDAGTTRQPVTEVDQKRRALSDEQLRELADLGMRLQRHFENVPQDIEWAFAEGRLWLLQSRPITGLPAPPLHDVRWEPPIPGSKWIRRQIVEHMPGPLSPLFDELYLRIGLDRSTDQVMELLDMGVAVDAFMDRPLFTTVNGFAYMRADTHIGWQTFGAYVQVVARGIPALFKHAEAQWRDIAVPEYSAEVARWKAIDLGASSDIQLLDGIRAIAWADARYWFNAALVIGQAKVTDSLLDSFLVTLTPGSGLHGGQFLRGLPSKTLEAEDQLETLADQIRHSDKLRAIVAESPASDLLAALSQVPDAHQLIQGLQVYFERYGHQIYSLDFAVPTQVDDPLPVLVTLKAMADQARVDTAARRAVIVRARNALARETARSLDPIRRSLFKRMLRWAWGFAPNREEALFYVGYGWPTLRRIALELGRRLTETGSLEAADEVFYLESSELEGAIAAQSREEPRRDLLNLARERRELRNARMRLHPPAAVPPDYHFSIGAIDLSSRETQRRNEGPGNVLNGFAVSPGRITAPASVIMSPAEFGSMQPGSILVCPITTPAWTPLFAHASGLVTDIGGVLAHGSIVAREYGIPAVMGTGQGTQRIMGGQTITVDGDAGTVTLGDPPVPAD